MTSSTNPNEEPSASEEQETFLDPNEAFEEYVEDETADHPMSSDEEGEEMYEEEIIVDDSIQGFFLHTSPIYSVALYGNLAATGAGDDLGYVWDVTNGEMIMKLDGHTDSVTNVKFSTDGVFLATGGMDGQVRIWNVREKKLVVTMDAGDEVLWLDWHPSGPVLLGGMNDGTVWMWKIPSGTPMQIFSGHQGPCTAGSFSPNGKNIVTCSEDGNARFEAGALTSLAVNPASTVVAVAGTEGLVKLLNLANGIILATLGARTGESIENLAWATTLPILAVGCVDGRIYLYDTQTYRLRNTLVHGDDLAVTAMVLPSGSFELTSASLDKSVRRWDIRTGQEIARRTGHQDAIVAGLAMSKDGKKVITGGDDTVALVWGFD